MIKICAFSEVPVDERRNVISLALSSPYKVRGTVNCLTPTWEMVRQYKRDHDQETYTVKYRELVRERWQIVRRFLNWLDSDMDCYLCCWEPSGQFCHRYLVAKLIQRHRSDLDLQILENSEDSRGERPANLGGSEMKVKIWTDGACSGNPGPAGWAAILQCGSREKQVVGGTVESTNNRMELAAVIAGLATLKFPCKVTIYTDSQYVIGILSLGWKRKANHDMLVEADALMAKHNVSFKKVKGHSSDAMNERCDQLAKAEVERQRSIVEAPYSETCDRCGKRVSGDELERSRRWSSRITFCDECRNRNDKDVRAAIAAE